MTMAIKNEARLDLVMRCSLGWHYRAAAEGHDHGR
jgi:hypothetical protein